MDNATQQFLYRAVIITVCLLTGAIFLFLFISAIILGDGEAIKIIAALQPAAISCLGAMVTTALGSHMASAFVARQALQTQAAVKVAQAAPNATPATGPEAAANG